MKFWKSLGIAALVSSLIPYACERDEDGARTYTALLYKLKRRTDPEAEDKHLVDLELGLNNPFAHDPDLAEAADADPFGDEEPVLHVLQNAAEKAEPVMEKVCDAAEDLMEKAQPYVEKVCDAAQPYVEKARDAAGDLAEKAQPYVEKARDAAQELVEKAQPVVEDAADKAFEAANHAANVIKDKLDS